MAPRKNSRKCKRKRVRKNSSGTLNQSDLDHNQRCAEMTMLIDNPWILEKNLKRKSSRKLKSKPKRKSAKRKTSRKRKLKSKPKRRSVKRKKSRTLRRSVKRKKSRTLRRKKKSRRKKTSSLSRLYTPEPPRGIISNAWVNKYCPCRDGDDCIPCSSHLKKYKDGRKLKKKSLKIKEKLKFRITSSERNKIDKEDITCPICFENFQHVPNKDIVGCIGASKMGWTCCSKKTGCKKAYFHKKCIDQWITTQKENNLAVTCPACRAEEPKKKPGKMPLYPAAMGLTALALGGLTYLTSQTPGLQRCYNTKMGGQAWDPHTGEDLPNCNPCNYAVEEDGWLNHYQTLDGTCPDYFTASHKMWNDETPLPTIGQLERELHRIKKNFKEGKYPEEKNKRKAWNKMKEIKRQNS